MTPNEHDGQHDVRVRESKDERRDEVKCEAAERFQVDAKAQYKPLAVLSFRPSYSVAHEYCVAQGANLTWIKRRE
jgi:hypothetical protein